MQTKTTLKDFVIQNKLGEGAFSNVYKVKRVSDSQIYAMKKVKMNVLKPKERENAVNEVRLLASINSDNIVGYKDAFIEESCLYVIMEFCQNGDIQGKITQHTKKRTTYPEQEIWKALIDITKGLRDLHKMKILHRDLKCANIFIDENGAYKLGDMNVSKVSKKGLAHTQTGTPYYAAPEIWSDKPYDNKCDIWSLGCVIYEMAALKPPFRAMDMEGLYRRIQKGQFDRIPRQYSNELNTVISAFLKVTPRLRPDAEQILANPIVMRKSGDTSEALSNLEMIAAQDKKQLLNTIICPPNLQQLNAKLPKAQYEQSKGGLAAECPEFQKKSPIEEEDEQQNEKEAEEVNLNKTRRNRIISAGPRRQIDSPSVKKVQQGKGREQRPSSRKENEADLKRDQQLQQKYQYLEQHQYEKREPLIVKHVQNSNLPGLYDHLPTNNKSPISKPYHNRQSRPESGVSKQSYNQKPPLINGNNRYQKQQQQQQQSRQQYGCNYQQRPLISRPVSGVQNSQQYNHNGQKYEYLYQKYQRNDSQQNKKNDNTRITNRPYSAVADLTPSKQLQQQQQYNNKMYYRNASPSNYSKQGVSQSYDYNKEIEMRLKQKQENLLGRYNNLNINNNNYNLKYDYNRVLNRHQSAKNCNSNHKINHDLDLYSKYRRNDSKNALQDINKNENNYHKQYNPANYCGGAAKNNYYEQPPSNHYYKQHRLQ